MDELASQGAKPEAEEPGGLRCDFCGEFMDTVASDGTHESADAAQARFRRTIGEWGLDSYAEYHGVVRGAHKIEFLRRAHVFVLPTWYPWEGQPMSIIEATTRAAMSA